MKTVVLSDRPGENTDHIPPLDLGHLDHLSTFLPRQSLVNAASLSSSRRHRPYFTKSTVYYGSHSSKPLARVATAAMYGTAYLKLYF